MNESSSALNQEPIEAPGAGLSAEQFIVKLRGALQRDGDFPASAKVVADLRLLANDPRTTASQLTEVILQEPTLGARVLNLVNSSYYRRGKPVMTVSQAVIQVGMKALIDLCAGLILLQKFVGTGRRGGAFAMCLQQSLITSLLSSSFASTSSGNQQKSAVEESGYLAGSLAELGPLLVAYYFPQVYDRATKRAETKGQLFSQSLYEIIGISRTQLSLEIVAALELPDFFREVLTAAEEPQVINGAKGGLTPDTAAIRRVGNAIYAARSIAETITANRGAAELTNTLNRVTREIGVEPSAVATTVGDLPAMLAKHCAAIEVNLPSLPAFVTAVGAKVASASPEATAGHNEDRFNQYADEIRAAVKSREPPASIITTVMETLVWGLDFQRVLLLLATPGRKGLSGRMALGNIAQIDPKSIQRSLEDGFIQAAPDAVAFRQGRPVFLGTPLLPGGWPLVAIPVGFEARCIGVVYADRLDSKTSLSEREQASIGLLTELLDRAIAGRG